MESTLRARREALGYSRAKFAIIAGISAPAIELFEGGFRPEKSRALEKYEAALASVEKERLRERENL